MTNEHISKIYPLATLFIHSSGIEVTTEKLSAVLKALNQEFSPKLGKLFSLPAEKVEELMSFVGSSASAAPVEQVKQEAEVVVEEKKEEKNEDVDIEFDDLFG